MTKLTIDPIQAVLRKHGPLLSSGLARVLVAEHSLAAGAARKRISRTQPGVKRLAYLTFPRNARFMYLQQDYGSPRFWDALTGALISTNSAYGGAIIALEQRGGLMPKSHFLIACGAPIRQTGHLSSEVILQRLKQAKLVAELDVPGVGPCVARAQEDSFYEPLVADLRARLVTEAILLKGIRMWVRNLGLGSYSKVALRDEVGAPPKVGTLLWDLTAPSYIAPLVEWRDGKPRPGFIACDVLLGSPITGNGLRPFLQKCATLRSLRRVGRCLQLFVADRYDPDVLRSAKERGIVAATPETLFGHEVAVALTRLTDILKEAATAAVRPEVFNELFERLDRIEGAATNLRGALFELVVAALAREKYGGSVTVNRIFRNDIGEKAEVDVLAEQASRTVHFIECKGYQPAGTVDDGEVDRWLDKRIPLVRQEALKHPEWKNRHLNFEFWTTGKLSEAAIAKIEAAKTSVRPGKYTLDYRTPERVLEFARDLNARALIDMLEKHFFDHPLATLDQDVERKMKRDRPRLQPMQIEEVRLSDVLEE